MFYRNLGSTGLKTSAITLGTGSLHNVSHDDGLAIFRRAYDLGINHFDTAESYGGHATEAALGKILRALGLGREKYILSTKAFTFGWSDPDARPYEVRTLNRKYLFHAIDRSLAKLGTDFVDIYYCHNFDPETPIAETTRTMSDIVQAGKARYWAVSNWNGAQLAAACDHADRYGLHRPICNQVEYSLLHRRSADATIAQARLHGVGLCAWGPLAGGLLSGKYLNGIPQGSRATDAVLQAAGMSDLLVDEQRNAMVARLAVIAADIGCSVGQLAIAWCLLEPQFSTVLTAASNLAQLEDSSGAVATVERLTPQVLDRVAGVIGDYDQSNVPENLING